MADWSSYPDWSSEDDWSWISAARDWSFNSDWAVTTDWAWDWLSADWASNDDWFGLLSSGYGGTIAGTATVTGALTNEAAGAVELAGTPSGTATVTAAVTLVYQLAGTPTGTGTATGSISQVHQLASSPSGVATVTGTITALSVNDLAATTAGVATVTGTLSTIIELAATTTGTSTNTGTVDPPLTPSAIAGTATVTGTLVVGAAGAGFPIPYPLSRGAGRTILNLGVDPIRCSSTVTGYLAQVNELSGTIAGTTTVADVTSAHHTYKEMVVAQGPQYYWKLDEPESTTALDTMGNQNLTWTNSPPRTTAIVFDEDEAYTGGAFDGTTTEDGNVRHTTALAKSPSGNLTVEVWTFNDSTYLDPWLGDGRLILNGDPGNSQWEYGLFRRAPTGGGSVRYLRASWRSSTNTEYWVRYDLSLNTLYHFVWVVDLDNDEGRLYVNGVLEETVAIPENTAMTPTSYFSIGAANFASALGGYSNWDSSIDEVAVYHKVLSPYEIVKHYQTGLSGNDGIGFENRAILDENRYRWAHGSSTVTGLLAVGANDGSGNPITELAGTIAGTSICLDRWVLTQPRPNADPDTWYVVPQLSQALYLYMNVGVGFEPTDTYSGTPVTQTFPDGHVRDFDRVLYLYHNVGVGFDPTDDASGDTGFVSQTFPDGHVRQFDRVLYDYLCVIEDQDDRWWVTIGPTPETVPPDQKARPPKSRA